MDRHDPITICISKGATLQVRDGQSLGSTFKYAMPYLVCSDLPRITPITSVSITSLLNGIVSNLNQPLRSSVSAEYFSLWSHSLYYLFFPCDHLDTISYSDNLFGQKLDKSAIADVNNRSPRTCHFSTSLQPWNCTRRNGDKRCGNHRRHSSENRMPVRCD
jgi:hypothetical protein